MVYVPQRGDIIFIDLPEEAGHEIRGRRPAFVLSPSKYNAKVGLVIVCPITNQIKGYPFEVTIPPGHSVTGVILVDQLRSIDWNARNAEYECHLQEDTITDVLDKLATLLWE